MKQVKGSMLKMIIKSIKANKSGIYDNMLSDKAKDLLSQRILDSIWYSFEVYKECFNALSQVEGKNNPLVIVQWGRHRSEELMTSIYQSAIIKTNLKIATENYKRFHRTVFNFGEIEIEIISDHEILVIYKDFERDFENFYYISIGWIQRFFELCLGKKVTYKILKKSWEGAESTQFSLSWAS
ncbi:MAG: hypothetical protein LUQ65_12455 [Candidatus Helarchaeota archaeon]|nr:hypothetical protein [Candidatus Helarchaeota archaeon]